MHSAQEGLDGLVVASGDSAAELQASKEVLDQVRGLVQVAVVTALHLARADAGDHRGLAGLRQRPNPSALERRSRRSNVRRGWSLLGSCGNGPRRRRKKSA